MNPLIVNYPFLSEKTGKEKGIECFIWRPRTLGYFALKKLDGTTIHNSVHYT
jgi:hypothetical protein